ncbi:beta-ketoacyl-[acyl-carrier-protein] synthase family protein [Desulfoplanes sp.]
MRLKRVVITGMGGVSPFGKGLGTMFAALEAGKSGISACTELEDIGGLGPRIAGHVQGVDPKEVPRKYRRSMSRMSIHALLAAWEALGRGNVDGPTVTGGRLGIALGSTVGSVDTMESFFKEYLGTKSIERIKSMLFFRIMGHSCAANVAQTLGITGRTLAPSAACSTGCQAVGLGYETIALGRQDLMLCGGADEFHPLAIGTFDIMYAASTGYNETPEKTPRPFDRDRDGIVCSEGAGILLLESLDSALARNAPILAEIVGFATSSDSSSIVNPEPAPLAACMRASLEQGGLATGDVDYVNAHATGTVRGDGAEIRAIHEVFGPSIPVSSLKGHLGHTMAASGSLELAACVHMLRTGMLIPTLNLDHPSPECTGVHLLQKMEPCDARVILKNNFALGGVNCTIALRRYSHD